jgi:hypothetical protein
MIGSLWADFRREAIGFLLSSLLAFLLFDWIPQTGFVGRLVISAIVGVATSSCILLFRAREGVVTLLQQASRFHPVEYAFLNASVSDFIEAWGKRWRGDWTIVAWSEIQDFFDICFQHCRGRYAGTDRNVPSKFFRLYPRYVVSQRDRAKRSSESDLRIVMYSSDDFNAELRNNARDAKSFVQSNINAGVDLLHVPFDTAQSLAATHAVSSTDIGVFGGRFVVYFEPPVDPAGTGRVMLKRLDKNEKGKIRAYLRALIERSQRVVLHEGLPTFTELTREEQASLLRAWAPS